jgi:acyl-CoA hydrolase
MGPGDANSAGFIHGGTVMRYCDEAAGLAAVRHAGGRVVTAGMDRMTFLEPVRPGDVMTFRASVNAAWRTSMEVGVRVEAENPRTRETRHTTTAYLTMVALSEDGSPAGVSPLRCESEAEHRREREAQLRRANRLREREDILRARSGGA